MRAYQNVVLDFLQNFSEYKFLVVPRRENVAVDAFATSASNFEIYSSIRCKYKVEVKCRLVVPDNMWLVFENDKHLEIFF